MNTDEHNDALARLISDTVRDLPSRTAPASLSRRVLDALERRAPPPWWRRDFYHWPLGARVGLIGAAAVGVRVALGAREWMREAALVDLPPQISWIEAAANALSLVAGHLPTFIVYGGVGLIAALYVALFAIGAIGYRTLFSHSS